MRVAGWGHRGQGEVGGDSYSLLFARVSSCVCFARSTYLRIHMWQFFFYRTGLYGIVEKEKQVGGVIHARLTA